MFVLKSFVSRIKFYAKLYNGCVSKGSRYWCNIICFDWLRLFFFERFVLKVILIFDIRNYFNICKQHETFVPIFVILCIFAELYFMWLTTGMFIVTNIYWGWSNFFFMEMLIVWENEGNQNCLSFVYFFLIMLILIYKLIPRWYILFNT